jgi:hypothetical protein
MKKFALLILMLLVLTKADSYACARLPLPPTADELKSAIHVVGDVIERRLFNPRDPEGGADLIIRVRQSKGPQAPEVGALIALSWPSASGTCFYRDAIDIGGEVREYLKARTQAEGYRILWRSELP